MSSFFIEIEYDDDIYVKHFTNNVKEIKKYLRSK